MPSVLLAPDKDDTFGFSLEPLAPGMGFLENPLVEKNQILFYLTPIVSKLIQRSSVM